MFRMKMFSAVSKITDWILNLTEKKITNHEKRLEKQRNLAILNETLWVYNNRGLKYAA